MPLSVTLSRSEGSLSMGSEMLRCAQHDSIVIPATSHGCHPERSEGSVALGSEMLRCGSA